MKTLMCNVLLTRRSEMCFIQHENGDLWWSGKEAFAAVTFLLENGHHEFLLSDGDDCPGLHITVRRV